MNLRCGLKPDWGMRGSLDLYRGLGYLCLKAVSTVLLIGWGAGIAETSHPIRAEIKAMARFPVITLASLRKLAESPQVMRFAEQSLTSAKTLTGSIASLTNGRYQFCSESEPQDWRDGAGVCAVFSKVDRRFDGYFGYPHSDHFICLRGMLTENTLKGQALSFTWVGSANPTLSKLEKDWVAEPRIQLQQPKLLRTERAEDGWIAWVRFQQASLDFQGLRRYVNVKMRSASELCSW